jgi:hypothetical protein
MRSVRFDQAEIPVTPNLETALLHLRKEGEVRKLWVDALCINQDDLIEKQQQVRLMSKIYPQARTVLCWLGPEEGDSIFAVQRLRDINSTTNSRSGIVSSADVDDSKDDSILKLEDGDETRFLNALFQLLSGP